MQLPAMLYTCAGMKAHSSSPQASLVTSTAEEDLPANAMGTLQVRLANLRHDFMCMY
jgi:hypothetical protein